MITSTRRVQQLALQLDPSAYGLLRQQDDGSVVAEDFGRLEQMERSAVARQNYRQAALLHATVEALRRKPPLTREKCTPAGIDAQEDFFLRNGFVVVNGVLAPEQLSRARIAWASAQMHVQKDWEARGQPDGYFDIPSLLELDDVFIDMADSVALVPLMARLTGFATPMDPERSSRSGDTNGGTRVSKMTGRVVPSSGASSYTWWHKDVRALYVVPNMHPAAFCLCIYTEYNIHADGKSG